MPTPHLALEQAAEWFALLRSGEAGEAERGAWRAWLAASEAHRSAWAQVERISRRFEPIQASPDPRSAGAVLQAAQGRAQRGRRRVLLGAAALAGAGALGWGLWREDALAALLADQRSGIGELRELVLADGTRVWLGPASALDVDYRPALRRLRLRAGEVFVETAHDAARDFVVDTPHGRARALGTRFELRLRDDARSALAVYEGAVEVRSAGGATTVLRAGQQTRFDRGAIETPADADPARQAWTRGILIAQDMALAEVVAELARYQRGHFAVAPEVAGLRVVGSFPLHDTGRALAMLARVLPIEVRRPLPWWTAIEAKK